MRNLFAAYITEEPDLMPFYAAPPRTIFSRAPETPQWPAPLVREINAYQREIAGSGQVSGTEIAIVTGQQPALFTGPLYTIYKAITAIRIARRLQESLRTPCLPVFWVGADDHDFEEARTAHFLTKRHEPLSLSYTPERDITGLPMFRVPIEDSLHTFVDQVAAETPGSEFRSEVAEFLHDSLRQAQSLADWSARLLARLFHGTNLLIFAPQLPAARALAAPVLQREIAAPLQSTQLLNQAGERLEALGFPRQITKADTECGFFLDFQGRRRKVVYQANRFHLSEENLDISPQEMLRIAEQTPERLSPNVALRCVVQQHLFPAAAYVAGPGEIAYWGQLKPLFAHFGADMPIVYPRAQCLLTTSKLTKLMTKFAFAPPDLNAPIESLLDRALSVASKNPAREVLDARRAAVESALQDLSDDLRRFPAAAPMAEAFNRKTRLELDRLETTLLRADTAQTDAARKQVERLCHALAPWRKPQERVYTVFSFLFEHGWELIPRLLQALNIESFTMNEVEL